MLKTSTWVGGRPHGVDISANNVAYITQLDGAIVVRVDLPSFALNGFVAVGSTPTGITFHPAGLAAWVANQFSSPSSVGVIDVATNTQVRTITSGLAGNLFFLIARPDGGSIYVSSNNGNVYAINAVTDKVMATLALGGTLTDAFAFHPDGVRLYADQASGGSVKEIDTQTNTVLRTFPVGGSTRLEGMGISLDGTQLYVADEVGVVRVVDIASGLQVAAVTVGGRPEGLAVTRDNAQIYVSVLDSGVVKVIDRPSLSVVNTIRLPAGAGALPREIAFSVAGETAVITDENGWAHFVQ